ncbi:hypothetical protein BD770DRAFT_392630 [Pilaira anomala]|nr:hypothetical protein BD770DRAFT_392630 [Pilaira anomala]
MRSETFSKSMILLRSAAFPFAVNFISFKESFTFLMVFNISSACIITRIPVADSASLKFTSADSNWAETRHTRLSNSRNSADSLSRHNNVSARSLFKVISTLVFLNEVQYIPKAAKLAPTNDPKQKKGNLSVLHPVTIPPTIAPTDPYFAQ